MGYIFPAMAQTLEASEACDVWSAFCCVNDLLAAPDAHMHVQLRAQFAALSQDQRAEVCEACIARGLCLPRLGNMDEHLMVAQLEGIIGLREACGPSLPPV